MEVYGEAFWYWRKIKRKMVCSEDHTILNKFWQETEDATDTYVYEGMTAAKQRQKRP